MPQATYGDAESLFRAAHNELMRVAYALLGNRADTEDGQERVITERGPSDLIGESGTAPGYVRSATMIALDTVQALVMRTEDYTSFIADFPGVPDLVKKQTYDRRTDRS